MNKTTQKINVKDIVDIVDNNSSNEWDDLCNKCSSIIRESGITDAEINKIINKSKKV